jgi:xanthine dehydrogenase/oxidase
MSTLPENTLVFALNRSRIQIISPDPRMLLIDFLRSKGIGLTGTKLSCGEGGCGACTVMMSKLDRETGQISHAAINACLRPICSLDGIHITTVEGLGDTREGLDSVQARIADMNGSQCGFCTPGMVMNAFALLQSKPSPSPQAIEDNFDGHICRCTGYRPILEAFRTFSDDADFGVKTERASPPSERLEKHPEYHHSLFARATTGHHKKPYGHRRSGHLVPQVESRPIIEFPNWLRNRALRSPTLDFKRTGARWLRANTLEELLEMKQKYSSQGVKVVAGNTSVGIYKNQAAEVFLDISNLPELRVLELNEQAMCLVGAGVTLQELLEFTGSKEAILADPNSGVGLRALHRQLRNVANVEVRSVASIGGNIAMTRVAEHSDAPFPSDVDTALTALSAEVIVASRTFPTGSKTFPIGDLPADHAIAADAMIVSFRIPLMKHGDHVRTYKVASRTQNAHAIVNAGFHVRMADQRVTSAVIAYGGIDRRTLRARDTEQFMIQKSWDDDTLRKALEVLGSEIKGHLFPFPDLGLVPDEYRISLAKHLFYKFFVSVAEEIAPGTVPGPFQSAGRPFTRPLCQGRQDVRVDKQESPVGLPLVNRNAYVQACGEARYTQDLPLPNQGLHGAVVLSRRAKARFTFPGGLDSFVQKLRAQFPLARTLITARNVPGHNLQGLGGDEPIFASGEVLYHGQLIGVVLSADAKVAAAAAQWVELNLEFSPSPDGSPVFSIEEALSLPKGKGVFQNNEFVTVIPEIVRAGSENSWLNNPTVPIDNGKVFHGTQQCGGQAHFYMETQTCLAIPDEGRTIQLHSSTQSPATDQSMTASALGIPVANVQLQVRRVGGGFGGKQFRAAFISAATAVAAWTMNRPIRISLNRNEDMAVVGKRHPFKGNYSVSVSENGKIDGMRVDLFSNGGSTLDCSFPVMNLAQQHADCCYFVPTFKTAGTVARTNNASNTAMRTFGVVQTTLIVEEALERIAHELKISPEEIRRRNFYETSRKGHFQRTHYGQALKYCNLEEVWDALIEKAEFHKRTEGVREFNRKNRWRKRGIAAIPLKFGMGFQPRMMDQASALVNIYATDGSVHIHHGGVEMGQGLHTKMIQIAAHALGIPMDWIVMGDTWTGAVPNAIATAASSASDLNGGAIQKACTEVRRRLEQFCIERDIEDWQDNWQQLWPTIVAKAYEERVNLSSQAHYKVPFIGDIEFPHQYGRAFHYFTYSASCSEVEIDVLTGETAIIRSDILYDAGNSLNPTIDVGQLEGGFVQGCGLMLTEDLIYKRDGSLLSNGTWNYKPPCSKSIPIDFRVGLHYGRRQDPVTGDALDFAAVLGSKGIGEPGSVLSISVFFAVKRAILAARADEGIHDWFEMPAPATVARIQQCCATRSSSLRL